MILRIIAVVAGVAFVALGLFLGPAPWLALIWLGVIASAAGLFVE